jgi:tripartite-type tricarboxylate transporter receptor subunit TctC
MMLRIAALLAAASLLPGAALSQAFPGKPIRIVMPNPPGGASDVLARMIQPRLAGALGQPIVVENRSGGGGSLGVSEVVRAPKDGHTIAFAHVAQTIGVLFVLKNPPFDPMKDLVTITAGAESLLLLAASQSSAVSSLDEVLEYARRHPGKLSIGSSGVGSYFHLMGESFKHDARIDMLHVPYKGAAGVINGLLSGQIDLTFIGAGSAQSVLKKIRLIAVGEPARNASLPDVPALREGVPAFEKLPSWFGFYGPAGLPRPTVERLNADLVKALSAADTRAWIESNGLVLIANSPEQAAEMHRRALDLYRTATRLAKVKPE